MTVTRRRWWPHSLLGQTLVSTAVILVLSQIVSLVLVYLLVVQPALRHLAQVTAEGVAVLSDSMQYVPPADQPAVLQRVMRSSALEIWTGAQPPDDSGPMPRPIERIFMRHLARALDGRYDLFWRTDHSRRLWIRVNLGAAPYWISVRSGTGGAAGMLIYAAILSTVLALLGSWRLNMRLLRPLNELRAAAEAFRLSAPSGPLSEQGPREIAALSQSFNRMTARLQRSEIQRAEVLAGISHDVRTPLAKLQLILEMMRNEDAALKDSARRQIDGMERILSQFMTFARGFDAEPARPLELNGLLEDLVADYAGHEVRFLGLPQAPSVLCRPEALRRAVKNLLENALRYGREPVELSLTHAAGELCIAVRDHGDGIAEASLTSIREPFVRADAARRPGAEGALPVSGTGLGLAIVEQVAVLHGGRLELINLPGGFCASLTLPAVQAGQAG